MAEYFEKETVLKEIFSIYEREFPTASGAFDEFVTKTVPNVLACIPSADVVPIRIGLWIPIYESELTGWNPEFAGCDPIAGWQCSLCRHDVMLSRQSNYCPNCGAKMEVNDRRK